MADDLIKPRRVASAKLTGAGGGKLELGYRLEPGVVVALAPFYQGGKGDKGESGDAASISADTPNALELGTDGKLLVHRPRQVQVTSWPPSFLLPDVEYVMRDPDTGLVSRWETDSEGHVFTDVNPAGVESVIAHMFVNSAGEPLINL